MARAHLPKRTMRVVDRLSRRAHAFHRFAHHPLCDRYASELIPLGRRARVCRGCASATLGAVAGVLAAIAFRPPSGALIAAGLLGLALLLGSLRARLPKSLGRALATGATGFACVGGLISRAAATPWLASGLLLASGLFFWVYRTRGPNRGPCQQCPERLAPKVCSGLRPIVQRERAFRRLAQRYVDAATASRI